jgi:CelD/BcsL family acetyltransferase involved in cellulose biosynthesis
MTAAAPPKSGPSGVARTAFASVEVFCDPRAALADWRTLLPENCASFYQTEKFLLTWLDHFGATKNLSPFFIVARDAGGVPLALLPLGLSRIGPLRIAQFLGSKHSNYNLGLFRADCAFAADDLRLLLTEAARKTKDGPHLYRLLNVPLRWRGDNPLALLPHQEAASHAYATELGDDGEAWLAARLSSDTRKKLRKKEKRLAGMGALRYFRAANSGDAKRILDAFFEQKRFRYADPAYEADLQVTRAFYEALTAAEASGAPSSAELHALALGDRIVATLAAGLNAGRLQGMFNSFDADAEIAKSSPGDILLTYVLRDCCARKLRAFDLGVGDARYKTTFCDEIETMVDAYVAVDAVGFLVRPFFQAGQAAKAAIKRNARLYGAAMKLRRG